MGWRDWWGECLDLTRYQATEEWKNLHCEHEVFINSTISIRWDGTGIMWCTLGRNWTFIGPCITNIFTDATFHNLFISVRHSTCFGQFFRPSSGAQNCTYSVRYLSDRYCYLQQVAVSVWQIPDAVCAVLSSWWWTEKPSETCRASYRNKLWNVASCWLYSANWEESYKLF